jgi:DNA-binding MarR family transcriptional regulator
MLESTFKEVYTKFKLNFYKGIFDRIQEREESLSAQEAYSVEVIHALNRPTISQFAEFLQVSKSNATYKINSLVKKGYIQKVQSKQDKRESHLHTTQKFQQYYAINQQYIEVVMQRVKDRLSPEDLERFDDLLKIISDELMPEVGTELVLESPRPQQS